MLLYSIRGCKEISGIFILSVSGRNFGTAKEYCKHPCLLIKLEVYPPEAAPKATRA
jgi:hypothetical protein